MAILFHARSLKEQLSLLNFIDKQFLINNYRINFINNQLSIDEFHAKRLHSEVFFRMKNLFCGPLGVQNLFCGPLGVQNLFCGLIFLI